MERIYSKFNKKGNVKISYAKVGNRVFRSFHAAEAYCTQKNLEPDDWIEYGDSEELKIKVQEIVRIQKPLLYGVMDRLDAHIAKLKKDIDLCISNRKTCHPLEQGYWDKRIAEAISKCIEAYDVWKIVWDMLDDLEKITSWKGGNS